VRSRSAIFGNTRQPGSGPRPATVQSIVRLVLVVAFAIFPALARADDTTSRHLVYAELLGKAGEYGIGYELGITPHLALGAAGSFAVVRGEQIATLAPYVHAQLIERRANSLFAEVGAVIAHTHVPSPVADWSGMDDTGGGGFASFGFQHATHHLVLRAAMSAVVGEGGLAPAIGFAIGWRP
jgi:hypothetical protein